MEFYTLTVKKKTQETEDSISLEFDVPSELRDSFAFSAGQYLVLRHEIDGEDVRRSYSLCSAPHEEKWRVGIKKVPDGQFSSYAHDRLQVGMLLRVAPPAGTFVRKDDLKRTAHYVAFAAGSGITPILSLINQTLHDDPSAHFDLFYGNRKADSIMFREDLEALKNNHLGRFQLHHILSRERQLSDHFYGRIDGEKCRYYANRLFDPQAVDQFFLCGPHAMIKDLEATLLSMGVDADRIQFELFTPPDQASQPVPVTAQREPGKKIADLTITLDGLTMDLAMMSEHESILDSALAEGVDLPYACKGGVCSTCKAKITQGNVYMKTNYALEPDEVARGYVLTCQAVPTEDQHIDVNFDL